MTGAELVDAVASNHTEHVKIVFHHQLSFLVRKLDRQYRRAPRIASWTNVAPAARAGAAMPTVSAAAANPVRARVILRTRVLSVTPDGTAN
jgi:hypothetical protein